MQYSSQAGQFMSWDMDIITGKICRLPKNCLLQRLEAIGVGGQRGMGRSKPFSRPVCPQCILIGLPVHGAQAEAGSEEYGGPKPFSEPESRVVRLVAETARPQAYVALHSGEYALYAPWDSEARPAWLCRFSGRRFSRASLGRF